MNKTYRERLLKTIIYEIVRAQDVFTFSHLNRVSRLAFKAAKKLQSIYDFSDRDVELISIYAGFHDIGKIGIPHNILNAPRKFTAKEYELVKKHPQIGYEIIENIEANFDFDFIEKPNLLKNMILQHHEYLDGSGYPYGITDEIIMTESRIVTICDIYDAMTSFRVYKKTLDHHKAIDEISGMADEGKLDKDIFNVFCDISKGE